MEKFTVHGEGGHGFAAQDDGAHGEAVQGASAGPALFMVKILAVES